MAKVYTSETKVEFLNDVISLLPECLSHSVKRFIACQFALESNFGSSPSAACNNNYCGMKVPATRVTLALNISQKGMFAHFTSLYSSICDYLLWLQSFRFTREELTDLRKFKLRLDYSGYCRDLGYLDKIEKIIYQYYGQFEKE